MKGKAELLHFTVYFRLTPEMALKFGIIPRLSDFDSLQRNGPQLETVGGSSDHNFVDPLSMIDAETIDDPIVDIR